MRLVSGFASVVSVVLHFAIMVPTVVPTVAFVVMLIEFLDPILTLPLMTVTSTQKKGGRGSKERKYLHRASLTAASRSRQSRIANFSRLAQKERAGPKVTCKR